MKVAAIDIGTNTTRMLIIDIESSKILEKMRTVTRLGENFNGILLDKAKNRVIETLTKYKTIMDGHNIERYRAVATSVVREAVNGREFTEEIFKKVGLKIEIINGQEEAKITFCGVISFLEKKINDFLLLDIGGGSNEFSLIKNRTLIKSLSEKFGVVFLYEKYIKHDPPLAIEIENLSKEIKYNINAIKDKFNRLLSNKFFFVGTAGTVTTLSYIHQNLQKYEPKLINNHKIPKKFLDELIEEMLTLTNIERFEKYKIEKGREDVILVGLLIIKFCMEIFNFDFIVSIDSGLLEGIAYSIKTHDNKKLKKS
jgi:exopolyphosphatase/guanosine-5'-triphosphate,3'-diphosphate pyrophosphatase